MKQGFKLLTVLLMTLLLALSATAQINWLKQDGGVNYLAWNDGTKSKTMFNGGSATFATGYFGSTGSNSVKLTVTLNSVATGKIVGTIASETVNNVKTNVAYKTYSINPAHYNSKSGEYIVVIKIEELEGINKNTVVDDSLYLKVKPKFFEIPIPFPIDTNDAPDMNNIPNKQVFENQNLQFTVSGTDENGDDLEYQAEVCVPLYLNEENCSWLSLFWLSFGNPPTLDKETGVFKWKPNYEFVDHPDLSRAIKFRFRADDGDKKSTWEEATITVKDVNRNPTFDNIPNKVVAEEQLLLFTVHAEDLDNDELTYSVLSGLPPGAFFNANLHLFKWVPNNMQSGTYSVTFKVEDGFGGKDLENMIIIVTDVPVDEPQCDDDLDNDGDGEIDQDDPGCHTDGNPDNPGTYDPTDNDETDQPVEKPECSDSTDNDSDGFTDIHDPGCHTDGDPSTVGSYDPNDDDESNEDKPECDDGIDNDGDGKIDMEDPDCDSPDDDEDQDKPECKDGKDNDGDGKKDHPNDPGCSNENDDDETDDPVDEPQCDDGLDNDGDGKKDYPADPGCANEDDDSESDNPAKPQCNDGLDNDGDGKIDFPADPGCKSKTDDLEKDPQCNDGIDNDGDGKIDYPKDPGCSHPDDNSETPVNKPQCDDGKDNDGDGKKDYPADPGCKNQNDNSELDPETEPKSVSHTNIKFKTVFVEGDLAYAGQLMEVHVNIVNNGDVSLKDVEIQATIYDIGGAFGSTSDFYLGKGQAANRNVHVPIPEEAQPGWYLVKVTAKNSHYHTSIYRLVYIDSNTFQ